MAIIDVKARFAKKPILALLNHKKLYILKINASDYILKAALEQKHGKYLYFIIFYYRKLLKAELNYKIYDKKLLAIIIVFKK